MNDSPSRRPSRRDLLRQAALAGGCWSRPRSCPGRRWATAGPTRRPANGSRWGSLASARWGRDTCVSFWPFRTCKSWRFATSIVGAAKTRKATVDATYAAARSSGTYQGCAAYTDLRELLARDDIDAVVIATGDRWHVPAGVLAAQAGKDIYCEKPISLTIHEARVMEQVARRYGCVFQAGLQQRSMPEFRRAAQLVQDGHLGRMKAVYVTAPGTSGHVNLPAEPVPETLDWDLWLGPAPWRPYNARYHELGPPRNVVPWNFCRDFAGGSLTANGVHAFDVVQWALGTDGSGPVEIIPPETGAVPCLTYRYADGVQLQVDYRLEPGKHDVPPGWDPQTPIEMFGALYVGEAGWIHVGRFGYLKSYPARILGAETYPNTHPVDDHHRNWLNCIRSRQRPVCDVRSAATSTIVSHLGCIAHWTGRALRWDPLREEFAGDAEANALRSRTMREPWSV